MRRKLIMVLLILGMFLLQSTVFPALPIPVTPNLLLILTVSFGFMHGKRSGLWIGFFCGLLIDIFYSNLFGFNALIYMYIGYMNGMLYKVFFDNDIKVPMLLVTVSDLAYNLVYYVFQFAFRERFQFSSYLKQTILPEIIFTLILTILLYHVFYIINKKLMATEMEEQQSLWLRK